MGTPLLRDRIGVPNANCWGLGFPGFSGLTPHTVTASFTDWLPAGQFLESMRHELESPKLLFQTADPEIWEALSDKWHWLLIWRSGDTFMRINSVDLLFLAFRSSGDPLCQKVLTNDLAAFNIIIAIGGIVTITFTEGLT